jgi:hypothetical protein
VLIQFTKCSNNATGEDKQRKQQTSWPCSQARGADAARHRCLPLIFAKKRTEFQPMGGVRACPSSMALLPTMTKDRITPRSIVKAVCCAPSPTVSSRNGFATLCKNPPCFFSSVAQPSRLFLCVHKHERCSHPYLSLPQLLLSLLRTAGHPAMCPQCLVVLCF